ncbi:hypothetical protein F3Y22_tig00000340pilonHSYRG00046 [Hibiscus syriacus]|uniref:Uncharacterized protein n=1 Tax=Hibiscus syriacus TaxID=106335 RepID=A0A6A3D3I6_HIBSY|nr:uncharacterized protein LOC120200416 [Hibiscus syriacus]KAE8735207.1 hypothetical protein F3Y22_tig00000340pilonHSYRG00046 [Hibiscus syriacus]
MSLQRYRHSSSFPSCFRPSAIADDHHKSPQNSGKTNIAATSLYDTKLGMFSLTWSRSFLGHSLCLHLHGSSHYSPYSPLAVHPSLSNPILHFYLNFNSFTFWKKNGCAKLSCSTVPNVVLFWDLSRAKFGSGPEPESEFFVAVVVGGEMMLLVGDAIKEAYSRTRAKKSRRSQGLVLRRERVFGNRVYNTKVRFGGKVREISIDCPVNGEAKLCFSVDGKRVLQIKRLKWKFRGSERVEVEGVPIQVSWDVYNWLFDKDLSNGNAVFVFKFENEGSEIVEDDHGWPEGEEATDSEKKGVVLCQQSWCNVNGTEWGKRRRSLLRRIAKSASSSSISMSSASSGGSSSVMEWASMEESELTAPTGFSFVVYACRK